MDTTTATAQLEPRSQEVRRVLEKFERATILQVLFSRIEGRRPEDLPSAIAPLYEIEIEEIRAFLMGA
jgi:hypothetical protein